MIQFQTLPPVMRQRAEWARNEIINHPEKSEIDYDSLLAWVFNEEDGLWYSIDGNYSQSSPKQKMDKRLAWETRQEELSKQYNEKWDETFFEQQYWSKVRESVLKRDKYTCQLCGLSGKTNLHIHHILKRNCEGTDHEDNLITVCPSCHVKADRNLYNPKWRESKNAI